jgi:hypothetical protein
MYFLGVPCLDHLPLEDVVVVELPVGTAVGVNVDLLVVDVDS